MKHLLPFCLISICFFSCHTLQKPYYNKLVKNWSQSQPNSGKALQYTTYLVGDAGAVDDLITGENIVLNAVQLQVEKERLEGDTARNNLVFLGDNIYPHGLPKKKDKDRAKAAQILDAQLQTAQFFDGDTYFLPGNHDWKNGQKGGLKAVKRQEEYIKKQADSLGLAHIHWYPKDGCADPQVVKMNKDLVFLFLDTQWWLQNWEQEKKMNKGCAIQSKGDLLTRIDELFVKHKNDEIVVFMHHPIKSEGTHGGYFSWKHHLFPTHEYKNSWIPLPILGSIMPLYRKVTGSVQDVTNAQNQALLQGINDIAIQRKVEVLFVSGHEHALQYFKSDTKKLHYIVSGTGSKTSYVKQGGEALYTQSARGFAKLSFYEDFETWLEFYTVADANKPPVLTYHTQLRSPRAGTVAEKMTYPALTGSDTLVAANPRYELSNFARFFVGKQYRDMWTTPVSAPFINLETDLGGLTPIKKGGNMTSNSLRMETTTGKHYILRSLNKDYSRWMPPQFANLKLLAFLQDQNSANHLYGALIIPDLSKAADVYYTTPKLVYLKHQKGLNNYNTQFNEELYLLEERPNGDWGKTAQFGYSEKIIGFTKLLKILRTKKNHFVDQEWVLKSRIFDLLIHDWDRHDDQWRWASFDTLNKTIYRPIPRDRDQAFYKFVGIIPTYVSTFLAKRFKTMKADVKDVKSLVLTAKEFDRHFLNALEWSEWQPIIKTMQENITDEIIEQSVLNVPEEAQHWNNAELVYKLKSRRDKLVKIGKKLYDFLSKEVDIPATDNDDLFDVVREADGRVTVRHFIKRAKKGNLLKYERTFYPKETKEVRLYGLRGKDEFIVSGADQQKIRIRVIGGEGKDKVENQTDGQVWVYDEPKGIKLKGESFKDKTSTDLTVNEYDRNGFQYNTNLPLPSFGFTPDDGFWFGATMDWTTHAWRKAPYQAKQKVSFQLAPFSQDAYALNYTGHFPKLVGNLDFTPNIQLNFPTYVNFFGLGNNAAPSNRRTEFHWVRMERFRIAPLWAWTSDNQNRQLQFGPLISFDKVLKTERRVSVDEELGFEADAFDTRQYLGATFQSTTQAIDNTVFPSNGVRLVGQINYLNAFRRAEQIGQLELSAQFYLTLMNQPKIVLANYLGYQQAIGDLQFYHYPSLGNTNYLRGFRDNRFRGESAFAHNIDLRIRLIQWDNDVLPMDIGLLGGFDYGRVWLKQETANTWHHSQTIGLWFNVLDLAIIQPHYAFTKERNAFNLRLGFNF